MREGGYLVVTREDGHVREYKTTTCSHCLHITVIRPGEDLGGFCTLCMRNICGPCADLGSCTPFEKKVEQQEREYDRNRMWASLGIR
jgi:hypothetical protein